MEYGIFLALAPMAVVAVIIAMNARNRYRD